MLKVHPLYQSTWMRQPVQSFLVVSLFGGVVDFEGRLILASELLDFAIAGEVGCQGGPAPSSEPRKQEIPSSLLDLPMYAERMITLQHLRENYPSLRNLSDDELLRHRDDMEAFAKLLIEWVLERETRSKIAQRGSLKKGEKVR